MSRIDTPSSAGIGRRLLLSFASAALMVGALAGVVGGLPQVALAGGDTRVAAADNLAGAPAEVRAFLGRVIKKVQPGGAGLTAYTFHQWDVAGKPTAEGVGFLPVTGNLNPETLIARVMDVDHYKGNLDRVEECRSIKDALFVPPQKVRFYQRVDISPIGKVHHELVLEDGGTYHGFRVAYWYHLKPETKKLDTKRGARSAYNVGAWLASPKAVGYALSSWPERDDLYYPQWVALTTGANATAKIVVQSNIDGMVKWAKK